MREGLALRNPATDVRAPKRPVRLPETVDVDDLAAMLDVTPEDDLEIRDHALLELFYSAGVRLAEAVGLDIHDVDLADGEARVLRASGEAFGNLYAAGGAACGVSGAGAEGYLSGNGLLSAVALGRVAGLAAAKGAA